MSVMQDGHKTPGQFASPSQHRKTLQMSWQTISCKLQYMLFIYKLLHLSTTSFKQEKHHFFFLPSHIFSLGAKFQNAWMCSESVFRTTNLRNNWEAYPVKFTSWNSGEIMVFHMVPNIPSHKVQRPIIWVCLLTLHEDIVLSNEVASNWMHTSPKKCWEH